MKGMQFDICDICLYALEQLESVTIPLVRRMKESVFGFKRNEERIERYDHGSQEFTRIKAR